MMFHSGGQEDMWYQPWQFQESSVRRMRRRDNPSSTQKRPEEHITALQFARQSMFCRNVGQCTHSVGRGTTFSSQPSAGRLTMRCQICTLTKPIPVSRPPLPIPPPRRSDVVHSSAQNARCHDFESLLLQLPPAEV